MYLSLNIYGYRFKICLASKNLKQALEREFRYFVEPDGTDSDYVITEKEIAMNLTPYDPERQISQNLIMSIASCLRNDFLFFHGSCIVRDGKAMAFVGPSGSGKSSIAIISYFLGLDVLTDDVVLVSKSNNLVYPFPKPVLVRCDIFRFLKRRGFISSFKYPPRLYIHPKAGSAKLSHLYLLTGQKKSVHPLIFLLQNSHSAAIGMKQTLLDIALLTEKLRVEPINHIQLDSLKNLKRHYTRLKELLFCRKTYPARKKETIPVL
ncbi:MAG: hypothetical protein HY606_11835 [Planctomycetes bacterium]|nr:hypothetical protein [Planctomycetota bacterium]